MPRTMRPFFIVLASTWAVAFAAAFLYSKQFPAFHWIWTAALPAFLLETLFYLGSVFESTRDWLRRLGSPRQKAALFWISALLPCLLFSLPAGTFVKNAFYLLAALSAILAFWYAILPKRLIYDIGFVIVAAAPVITKVFSRIYRSPDEHLRVDILGHLMWIRLGLLALLLLREWDAGPVSLWPKAREWGSGAFWFLAALVPVAGTAILVHDVRFELHAGPWWRVLAMALGVFFGSLWVVALSEELFFRGFIEAGLLRSTGNPALAVVVSTVLYGSVHLWFHGFQHFPDWRQASVAAVLGVFCGIAYLQTGTIRASMVTHALIIVVWRVFFKGV